ncbi:xanthine dehydrogenase family protein subunit M [Actinomadura sp. DC4]|uniref:FAD binding domain-containing protein n=1 Tax=Actinomadura sp. DC4 TaxID=3055069 RepID=UPI0025B267DA|nr:xanthine dehydrogenase family protein subunit M [Actinomadura sp. DC4]MDN3351214.1 xanthine dehydrogenase family protein subunit M [Actinomadura sp. DC4]
MKPGRFAYHAPRELDEALALLKEYGDDAKVLAGGQSLMPMLNFRLARIDHLIDVNRLGGGLDEPRVEADTITIPALVRQRQVERSPELTRALPLLASALRQVAHPQIRNRGTVCGSLAHADPAAELPSVMTALDARFTVVSADGVRTLGAADFFLFHLTTALEAEELLLEVTIDRPPAGTHSAFREFATRQGDFALAGVAVTCGLDDDGVVTGCRVAAAGIAPTPRRLTAVEGLTVGNRLDDALLAGAEAAARAEIDPTSDIHASAAYRRRLTGVLVRRALADVREAAHA